jgi:hypothetical protein
MPATPSNEDSGPAPTGAHRGKPGDAQRRGRALGIGSLVCFAISLVLTVVFVANAVDEYFHGDGGDMAGAPPAVLQMGLIHMIGMTGTVLGYLAPAGCRLARWGLWSNVILLVIFWLGIALSPI